MVAPSREITFHSIDHEVLRYKTGCITNRAEQRLVLKRSKDAGEHSIAWHKKFSEIRIFDIAIKKLIQPQIASLQKQTRESFSARRTLRYRRT
jgi:hypothetical protein